MHRITDKALGETLQLKFDRIEYAGQKLTSLTGVEAIVTVKDGAGNQVLRATSADDITLTVEDGEVVAYLAIDTENWAPNVYYYGDFWVIDSNLGIAGNYRVYEFSIWLDNSVTSLP